MPLLELRDVSARYGALTALHDMSLSVEEGEVVSRLGANGAGKTTTLRSISGTVKRSGTLLFDGKPLPRTAEAVARRGITHVPEGRGILGDLTVWENLRMGAYLRRDRKAVQQDLDVQRERLPWLWDRRAQQAGTLSGGEQQMLALARALVGRPRMVLLVVQTFFDLVRSLNREDGVTFLVVEQNATVALDVSQRAYVLEVGHIALSGESAELAKDEGIRSSYLGY
jgi:branched-chain amino acid transport system ATP-binding protein